MPAVEPWTLLPSLCTRGTPRWYGRCVRKTCSHNEFVQNQKLSQRPSPTNKQTPHAGRLTKVVCTPLVPLVYRNTRSCTSRGHIVRTWSFLLQILPNCSQCFYYYWFIQMLSLLTQWLRDTYCCISASHFAHKRMKRHMLVMSCAHRMHALVHTWCTQKYQKKYS